MYGIFDRIGTKYPFWLRVGQLSIALNSHKYNHNFNETPNANCNICQVPEDTYHFLFNCALLLLNRRRMMVTTASIMDKYDLGILYDSVQTFLYIEVLIYSGMVVLLWVGGGGWGLGGTICNP